MQSKPGRWRTKKILKPKPEDSPDTVIVITEDNAALYAYHFPQSRTISPLDKFWQEHRHEEEDEKKREKMDRTMEKYT